MALWVKKDELTITFLVVEVSWCQLKYVHLDLFCLCVEDSFPLGGIVDWLEAPKFSWFQDWKIPLQFQRNASPKTTNTYQQVVRPVFFVVASILHGFALLKSSPRLCVGYAVCEKIGGFIVNIESLIVNW